MKSRYRIHLVVVAASYCVIATQAFSQAPFSVQGPGVDSSDFRVTTFATGLNFPVGMIQLDDGSLLVATSNGSSFFGSSSGSLIRLADTDNDGVADVTQTLVNNVPSGKLSALRRSGDLVFVTGQGSGSPISIYRLGDQVDDPLSLMGTISISYSGSWLHPHSALAVRPTPGIANSYDLFFQLGSKTNFDDTSQMLSLTSSIGISGNLAGDAIHRIQITDNGASVSGSNLTQIATGLRNAAGMAFQPQSGDLYLQDNGIDGVVVAIEPTSADEINVIPAADIGGTIEDFGFPTTYVEYRTDVTIGSDGIQPLVAFQPIPTPNGSEAEGPNDIVFAPAGFPEPLRNGLFVGFHGQFSGAGVANEENPVVFVDLEDNSYFQFVSNTEPGIGHLDGLLSTSDSLFAADISPGGGFGSSNKNSGKIYQILATAPADFDGDGDVDGDDLAQWEGDFGINGDSDADGDGDSDGADLLTWQRQFTENLNLTTSSETVPEPTTFLLLVYVAILRLTYRAKSSKILSS